MAVAGKFNIQVGSLRPSQIAGAGAAGLPAGLSAAEVAELADRFAELRSTVAEQAPEPLRGDALAQAEQLERAVICDRPDPRTVRRALRWFRLHTPQLAGAVIGVLVDPLVDKLVDRAGAPVAERFRALLEPARLY